MDLLPKEWKELSLKFKGEIKAQYQESHKAVLAAKVLNSFGNDPERAGRKYLNKLVDRIAKSFEKARAQISAGAEAEDSSNAEELGLVLEQNSDPSDGFQKFGNVCLICEVN